MCVGPPTSPGRVDISWDPLPCHLQNGANISGYIIHYTYLPTGVGTCISSFDGRLICRQEPGGPYSCVAATSLFIAGETYSFQVAAQSAYGVGSFSNPITIVYGSQGKVLLLIRYYIETIVNIKLVCHCNIIASFLGSPIFSVHLLKEAIII